MAKFEERCADAMETIADAMKEISETTKAIQGSQTKLNDNFLLHQNTQNTLCADVKGIRDDFKEWFYPMFKWLVIVAVAAASGIGIASILHI